ncbi:hypothetical protein [Enterobacter kobei]|nr:hypothetical protein [Enterobacter kobei]MCR2768546.1 hypothetical protein [Enterobacter kobei]MCR2773477.1 hypothetical protein [Enterobacter kobei]MCR2794516.1 hypothetical protein [Enterobacter kobei]MDS0025823.1 hypothetical protein [Enterobacter kobei]OOV76827.1 hypothetical protein B1742_05245 [Enterobacter kobei]
MKNTFIFLVCIFFADITLANNVIFSCNLVNQKQLNIVLNNDVPQYIYGAPGKEPDLVIPSVPGDKNKVRYGAPPFSKSYGYYYRFINGNYSYVVFSGVGQGWNRNDLTVFKGDKTILHVPCLSPTTWDTDYDPDGKLATDEMVDSGVFSSY